MGQAAFPDTEHVVRDDMVEQVALEHVWPFSRAFYGRVESFKAFLKEEKEEKVGVVGHGNYFQAMLPVGTPRFGNTEIRKATFDKETMQFSSVESLYIYQEDDSGGALQAAAPETTPETTPARPPAQ